MYDYRFTWRLDATLSRAQDALALARQIQLSLAEIPPCHLLWPTN